MFNLFKKDKPLLSVVIPSYNHEKFIKQAIDSVLNQTYKNLELIVIDDGSKDSSIDIIKSYKDDRLTLVCQENAGAHNAINKGLSMAKGEYLAVLNSDDIFTKDRFEIMIKEMQKKPEVGFACTYIQIIDTEGNKLGLKEGWKNMEPWTVPHPELSFKATDDFKLNLLMTNFTSTTSNFLFTRDLYEKIGGMRNLRFAHDWDFALRAAEVTECMMIEKPLMEYRVHSSNTISSNRKWMLFEIAWMWATNLERFFNSKIFNEDDIDSIVKIAESLNLQGNDKIFWMIKVFLDAQKAKGVEKPEEVLLDNAEIRNRMLEYVVE
ncbi:MAG: glycosyltransferase [Lachnospiraceae bacterium]|nr:glycosyltransferase [Lachnospiraceae bacterium]